MGVDINDVRDDMERALNKWKAQTDALRLLVEEPPSYSDESIADGDDYEGALWVLIEMMRNSLNQVEKTLMYVHHGERHKKDIDNRALMLSEKSSLSCSLQTVMYDMEDLKGYFKEIKKIAKAISDPDTDDTNIRREIGDVINENQEDGKVPIETVFEILNIVGKRILVLIKLEEM